MSAVLSEEKGAVIAYALAQPKEGYWRRALLLVDADVAFLSPADIMYLRVAYTCYFLVTLIHG